MPTTLPYGSWPSPLSAATVASASPRIDGARFVGDEVWWGQTVPAEAGRTTVRRYRGTIAEDVLPAPHSARSRVHEYGGGAWTEADGQLVYSEKADQRVWALEPGGAPRALTPEDPTARFGGLTTGGGMLIAVRERHDGSPVPRRDIVRIPLDGSAATDPALLVPVVGGSDFVAQPAVSPDGQNLAWVAWDHPDMPWDHAEVRVGALSDGRVSEWRVLGTPDAATLQPEWTGEGDVIFTDDGTGRWNLYRSGADGSVQALAPADADTGGGLWVLGTRWYTPLEDGRIVAVRTDGGDEIVLIDGDRVERLPVPIVAGAVIEDSRGSRVLVSGSTPDGSSGLWLVDLAAAGTAAPIEQVRVEQVTGADAAVGAEWFPAARKVDVDGAHGVVHAFAYPPTHPDMVGPADELPPYLVLVHGGPTSHVGPAASAKIAFYTSRGIGVLDVNYGGSTGYGRAYRERLRGQWGIVDVDDVAAVAAGLAAEGRADPARLAIEGGSAGGWTVLGALVRTDVFGAGISRYGVGDARALAADTHDFEARYLDGLIGPLPEAEAVYIERSPLTHVAQLTAPMLILQGADDAVVPPAQAEAIRDALAAQGVAHAYMLYEGEGHGFRRAETVIDALERELAFLGAVFGFTPPGVPPLSLA
ncbi:prolyl oligopeptidase family serine peptidase [Microbacterium sp. P05]|uniref:S9 family peptidase n=1 Tax=Microbacterium sp. P05 TaxID=3366948 RepID=UPI0037466260